MAIIEYWIQLENHPWDVCPNGIDRITGETFTSVGMWNGRNMFKPLGSTADKPLGEDALILRRYKPPEQADQSDAWTVPDDRKVNPWDLNEPNPTDTTGGTKGTIPGPVIECNVGDSVIVHFRNMDNRATPGFKKVCINLPFIGEFCINVPTTIPFPVEKRTHSLHPHGFVFAPTSDGAYPLSPPDPGQPVAGGPALGPDETALWATVPGFSGTLKKGDRIPPGGTFTYRWNTIGWPTTAGVWLYHDHSICDMDNVNLGAIGIIVIHDPDDIEGEVDIRDPNDPTALDPAFLPGGSPNGDPRRLLCFPFPQLPERLFPFREIRVLPHDLEGLGAHDEIPHGHGMAATALSEKECCEPESQGEPEFPVRARTIRRGDMLLELDEKLQIISKFCLRHYRTPPTKALYLQLFHTLTGTDSGTMLINGRTFLGNTPTMVAGPATRMRFGVVGMGDDFHTFHIHGHRWLIPGPSGFNKATGDTDPAVLQFGGPMISPVSQFEDTKIFGPANSFGFTINEGNGFMRASPAVGEWHMHCHVLSHMMHGMMGSLLVVNGGELALPLPVGVPCDMPGMPPPGGGPKTVTVHIRNDFFDSDPVNINAGDTVEWVWDGNAHSTTSDTGIWDSGVRNVGAPSFPQLFPTAGNFPYHCTVHGGPGGVGMHGTVIAT